MPPPGCGEEPAILLEDVWKRYWRTWALRGVSLRVDRPGVHVLYGPNGSGKSTIISLLLGVTRPTRGTVRVLGVSPEWRPSRILRRVSAAVEGANLPPYTTGRRLAAAIARERRASVDPIEQQAAALGVTEYWDRPVFTYSMGMRKRLLLSIALGLAESSCLLVLDEPYTLLDPHSRERLAHEILEIAERIPVLIATHISTLAEESADTLTILDQGRIARTITRSESNNYKCPNTPATRKALEQAAYRKLIVDNEAGSIIVVEAGSSGPLEGAGCKRILLPRY